METIRLLTSKDVLVVAEIEGVRERSASEVVHYRKTKEEPCHLCNAVNGECPIVWLDNFDRWRAHPARCNAVAFICNGA